MAQGSVSTFQTETDAEGQWHLLDLPDDVYEVSFSKSGLDFFYLSESSAEPIGPIASVFVFADDLNIEIVAQRAIDPSCSLSVEVMGNGQVEPNAGSYPPGTKVTLTAMEEQDSFFAGWIGLLEDDIAKGHLNSSTITIVMNRNISLKVEFTDLIVQINEINTSLCPLIQATVLVTDADGVVVTDVNALGFSIYEDDVEQTLISVEHIAPDVCVSMALDCSSSMGSNAIASMEKAAIGFVQLMQTNDWGQVIKFANGLEIAQEYTNDREALIHAIQRSSSRRPNATSLYDAIYQAISDTAEQLGGKAVVVMSDGEDKFSQHSRMEVLEYAKSNWVPVFAIGLGDEAGEDVFKTMAIQTGGLYYTPSVREMDNLDQKTTPLCL